MFEKITAVEFSVSSVCNLDCEYCYLLKEEKERQIVKHDFNDLYSLLDKMNLSDSVEVHITGAEVSLCDYSYIANGIKKIQKIEKKKDTKINCCLTTNLSNPEKIIGWLDEGLVQAANSRVSWDGLYSCSKSRLPKNKSFTDEFFNGNIKLLGQTKHASEIIVRMAVTENTVADMAQSMEFLIDCGFRNIEYYFLYNYNEITFSEAWRQELHKIYQLLLRKDFNLLNIDNMIIGDQHGYDTRNVGCPHFGKKLYIDFSGNIYACGCEMSIAKKDKNRLAVGHITTGLDENLVSKLLGIISANPKTISCTLSHCFCCQGDNALRVNYGAAICDSCVLRRIEKEIYDIYKRQLSTIEIDQRIKYGDYKELPFVGSVEDK